MLAKFWQSLAFHETVDQFASRAYLTYQDLTRLLPLPKHKATHGIVDCVSVGAATCARSSDHERPSNPYSIGGLRGVHRKTMPTFGKTPPFVSKRQVLGRTVCGKDRAKLIGRTRLRHVIVRNSRDWIGNAGVSRRDGDLFQ